jgi:septal ring factor EnvC (AmiA/AmiB activator)
MHGMEVNMDKDRRNTVKIVSTIISLGIIAALIIGVVSVIKNVNANRNESGNIVNLNETEENVAMKTEDAEENIDESDVQDELLEANARGRMAEKNESVEKNNDELMISDKEDTTMQEEATVPPTLSSEEVMAEAMRSFTFDESNKLAWPVLGHITLDYSMDETVLFKSLGVYKCSPGIIISSEVGTNVAAAASGVVTDVAELSETGTTVTVSIGNGYETTTGMIENVNLKKGDKVTTGQLIGTVASPSAYYIEEGPGVYFKLTQYGEPVNPDAYFVE